ncbi:hypothetical protein jhhlp_003942 [Lomentospora prolificans]|uniref:NAD(P)-binding domain-containing protein n=1 Tax=Lomentospora prolificans TaxID=41688 RepID=A0A2N3NA62_9PEZI|nr:hypothetical protein jhhlp_003942 [Lomentospora prolificans]
MNDIKRVAASGNFGTPITTALVKAGFDVTIISRAESNATFPDGLPVIRIQYTLETITDALQGHHAAVCVVGPAGMGLQSMMVDAAAAAGVKRFIVDDFGWGIDMRGLPEFKDIHNHRRAGWDHAKAKAEATAGFTFTGISTGNPIDWVGSSSNPGIRAYVSNTRQALKRFPVMGFNIATRTAIIYDDGNEAFTGTTLQGIGQSVVGVLQHPEETANRFVRVLSIKTTQNQLLAAFKEATGTEWEVQRSTTAALLESGRKKKAQGSGGWVLDLVVAQLLEQGEARCVVAPSWEESDSGLLGVGHETAHGIVAKALNP